MKRRLVLAALLAALAPSMAVAQDYGRPSFGASGGGQDEAREAGRGGAPLAQVLARIASRTPGRHLNTTTGGAGGHPVYFVQWQLPDGRVVIFIVDRESGQVIGRQGG